MSNGTQYFQIRCPIVLSDGRACNRLLGGPSMETLKQIGGTYEDTRWCPRCNTFLNCLIYDSGKNMRIEILPKGEMINFVNVDSSAIPVIKRELHD